MRVFITGGTGFIGSYLVHMLLGEGHEVTAIARNPKKVAGFIGVPNLTLVEGDVLNIESLDSFLPGHDAVIHVALCWGNTALDMLERDTRTSVALFEKSARAGIKHFIYTSSTAAFGAFLPVMTEEMKSEPIDQYCATKASSESYLIAISHMRPMRCNIIRPGYTFGTPIVEGAKEGADGFRAAMNVIRRGEDYRVKSADGTQFIWAGHLAEVYRAVLNSDINRQIYHALSETHITWERIGQECIRRTGSTSKVIVEENKDRPQPYLFDLSKLDRDFGLRFDAWPHVVEYIDFLAREQ